MPCSPGLGPHVAPQAPGRLLAHQLPVWATFRVFPHFCAVVGNNQERLKGCLQDGTSQPAKEGSKAVIHRGLPGGGSRLCGPRFPESSLTLFLDILRHTGMSDEDPATKPQFSKWKATATLYRTANFPLSIWYLRKHAHTCTCSFKRLQKRLKQKRPECWASDQVTPETLCVLTSSAETETASFRSATTCGRKTGIHVTPAKPEQPRRKHRVPKQRGLCAHRLRCALVAPLSPPALVNAVGTRDLYPSRGRVPSLLRGHQDGAQVKAAVPAKAELSARPLAGSHRQRKRALWPLRPRAVSAATGWHVRGGSYGRNPWKYEAET